MKMDEALGLPPGSVRAILAIGALFGTGTFIVIQLVLAFVYLPKSSINIKEIASFVEVPGWWVAILTVIMRDYFAGGEKRDTSKLLNGK